MLKPTLAILAVACVAVCGQAQNEAATATKPDSANAYYHYALARSYVERARVSRSREYLDKAIQNYKEAIKADPGNQNLSDELADVERGQFALPPISALPSRH